MKCKKVLLALALSLCALLCMAVTASADGEHTAHPICGATHTDIGDHKEENCKAVTCTWQPWDGTFEESYGQAIGFTYDDSDTAYIYLTNDVITKHNLRIPTGKHIYLCLNGFTIGKTKDNYSDVDSRGVID